MSEIEKARAIKEKCFNENNPNYLFWEGIVTALEWMESSESTIMDYLENL